MIRVAENQAVDSSVGYSLESHPMRVFVSYSRTDQHFARRLVSDLPHQVEVWIDEAQILVGDSLTDRIADAIQDAEFIIAILSSQSVQSRWVREELRQAETRRMLGHKMTILPVLISDCELPPFLQGRLSFVSRRRHLVRFTSDSF
jgi:predicted nucleotide-binding protein